MTNLKNHLQSFSLAFDELFGGNSSKFLELIKNKDEITSENEVLGEIYWTDLVTEWNKLQANSFIKTKTILDTDGLIPIIQSTWISAWLANIEKELEAYKFNKNYEFRKFPAKSFIKFTNELSAILKVIFKDTAEDHNKALDIDSYLLGYSFFDMSHEVEKKNLIKNIFICASLFTFKSVSNNKENKNHIALLISTYYGRENPKNKRLFTRYYTGRKKANKAATIEELNNIKRKELTLRDEDYKYWKYFLSFIPEAMLLEAFKATFEIEDFSDKDKTHSVSTEIFKHNLFLLMDAEIPKKEKSVIEHKRTKI